MITPLEKIPTLLADEARAALLTMAREQPLAGTAVPPKEDRYDRVRVQGFTTQWLQRALLEHFGTLLRQSGLKLRGLYPAAYCLPVDATQAPVVAVRDAPYLCVLTSLGGYRKLWITQSPSHAISPGSPGS